MKGYGEYKEVEAQWLGELPSHWDSLQLRTILKERKEKVSDKEFPPLSVCKAGIVPQLSTAAKSNASDNRKGVRIGDFVINSRSDRRGSSGISSYEGSVSLINHVLSPRGDIAGKFLHYLLRSHPFIEEFYRNGRGIVADLWTTRFDEMKTIILPLPPREEQDQIVRYLDAKVGKINKLIKIKQQKIVLLKEKKQAIINQAVTRGLDPNAPMKDSGIAWIGQIPEGWEVIPLKKVATIQSGITLGKIYPDRNVHTYPYICVANVQNGFLDLSKVKNIQVPEDKAARYMLQKNDVLMTEGGDPDKLGRGCLWNNEFEHCLHQNHIFAVRADNTQILSEYICIFLSSSFSQYYFLLTSKQTTNLASTNKTTLRALPIPLPNIEEQKSILTQLQKELNRHEALVTACFHTIAILTEYRTRLISDVVTGKVDVRGLAVPDTFEEEEENAMDGHPWLAQADEDEYSVADMEK